MVSIIRKKRRKNERSVNLKPRKVQNENKTQREIGTIRMFDINLNLEK